MKARAATFEEDKKSSRGSRIRAWTSEWQYKRIFKTSSTEKHSLFWEYKIRVQDREKSVCRKCAQRASMVLEVLCRGVDGGLVWTGKEFISETSILLIDHGLILQLKIYFLPRSIQT